MGVVILGQEEVARLLPMDECMEVMRRALATLAEGKAILPLRSITWLPERVGGLGLMPAYLAEPPVVGLKAVTFFPGNHGTELDSHQGVVLLFEPERGRLLAIIDATSITAIRTAAVSGVATRLLARRDAGDLALLGAGTQARTHLEAMRVARTLRRVRVWCRDFEEASRFAERASRGSQVRVEAMRSAREAVEGADLVCTVTASREPVLAGEWMAPGAHVNAVGACVPSARELDSAAIATARVFVDRRESAWNEAGELILARKEGAIAEDHVRAELGEVVVGRHPGRTSTEEITVFKSLGLAIEDLASAHHIYEKAKVSGVGLRVDLGGRRETA